MMNSRVHGGLKLVPWESWQQWNRVRESVFSSSPALVSAALDKIAAWRARGSLPVAVEVTGDLISIQMSDPFFSGSSSSKGSPITDEMLRLMYAMAIMRLVNGVVDQSKKQNSMSVALRAEAAGLPRMLVDIRHEVAHKELPSISYLQLASQQALEWLKLQYWEAQKQLSSPTLNLVSKYDSRDEICRMLSDPLVENTARFEQLGVHNVEVSKEFERSEFALLDARKCLQSLCKRKGMALYTNAALKKNEVQSEFIEKELERGEYVLLEVRKRLQSLCKGKDTMLHTNGALNHEVPSEAAVLTTHQQGKSSQKVDANEHCKDVPSKGPWSMSDTWRPCAIGMLPSSRDPIGVLPCFETPKDFSRQSDMSEVELPNKSEDQVSEQTGTAVVDMEGKTFNMDSANVRLKRKLLESKIEETPIKRIRAEDGAGASNKEVDSYQPVTEPSNSIPNSKGFAQDSQVGTVEKHSRSPVQGFLLLDGLYQRCGSEKIAAIESAIQVFK